MFTTTPDPRRAMVYLVAVIGHKRIDEIVIARIILAIE